MANGHTRKGADPVTIPLPAVPSRDEHDEKVWPHFTIGSHHFVAIPEKEWSRARCNGKEGETLGASGFVRLDGLRYVLTENRDFDRGSEPPSSISMLLTSRELQIAYSVAEGKVDKVIAHELGISEYTVREHMRRIFHKLKVSKRAALVARLIGARFDDSGAGHLDDC